MTFLFSFFAFFKEDRFTASAWDGDAGAFATTVPAILGLVMVVWIGLRLAGVSLPERVLTYNEALDAGSVPATGAFTVSGGHAVTGVAVNGTQVCGRVAPKAGAADGRPMQLAANLGNMHLIDESSGQVI